TSILDLDTLLMQVVNLIREQFGYYFVGIWLLTPDKNAAVLRAGTGTVGRALMDKELSIPLSTPSLISTVCNSGKSRIVEHVREVPDFLEVQELPNIVSEIVLPMYMGGELLGVMDISSDKKTLFTEVDQVLIQTLVNQIAIAIRNARLYQAEITRRRIAENLEYVGRTLTSSLDIKDIPGRVLDLLKTIVHYDRGMILLEEQQILHPRAIRGFPPQANLDNIVVPITSDDIYQQLYNNRTPIIIGDTTQNPGWTQLNWLPIHRSWMGVAIIVEDRMVGMISLTRKAANAFTGEDITWVQAFTPQAAIAIQNASLYSEIVSLNNDLEKRVQERTRELNKANRLLQQMDATKSNFIRLAAHELRTPLTVINGYSQMLKTYVEQQNAFALTGIETGIGRLTEVVNSMLDMAKIDTQSLDMEKQPVRMREVVDKVEREFQKALATRHVSFHNKGFTKLPVIQADPEMMVKVIHNLVSNAIKFTPDDGKVTIAGRTVTINDQQVVEIAVTDTGIGIAKEEQQFIFEKFHASGELETHSSGRTDFKAGGPGLGLSIARGIVLAHNGKIWVESDGYDEEKYPGSCFFVQLPIE
ncbi:MAG: GAF domain-containing protein, partial [Anaerolineae bacterium]|nr:GAF domain-containing protein [Anaerolineae bacterium]